MIVVLSLLVAIIGGVLYLLLNSENTKKAAELCRLAFLCGLWVFLLRGAEQVVNLLK